MKLNPFGVGLCYWNNWLQEDDAEFVVFTAEFKLRDGILMWSMGIVGFGFVFCWKLPTW